MKKWLINFVIICILGLACLPAFAGTVLYSTDFSTDPGWVTDQPSNYYWDAGSQTYHIRPEHHYPGYSPSRYTYKLLPEAVENFELQWDIKPTRCDWSIGMYFGIYDNTLTSYGTAHGHFILAVAGNPDAGHLWALVVCGDSGYAEVPGGGTWDFNQWYTCNLTYDAGTNKVSFEVKNRDTGVIMWKPPPLSVPGGLTNDLMFLGSSTSGIGDNGTYPGINPWAVAEGNIDNVVLSVISEPAIEAVVDIDPNTLNLQSNGKWITCYIRLPEDYNVVDINSASVVLNDTIKAEWTWVEEEEQFMMAKFNRSAVQDILQPGQAELTVSGELLNGRRLEGKDTITVINEGKP